MIRVPSFFVLGMLSLPLIAAAAGGPEREALLSATWLGQVGEEEGAKVAVSWKGEAPAWIEVFEDADGDGQLGSGERVVLERAVEKGMEVVPVVGGGAGALGLRWRGDGVEGVEELRAAEKGASCGWQEGFSVDDLDGPVFAMTVWDDGGGPALYVGGFFDTAGSALANNVARWDGFGWSALSGPSGTGTNNTVLAISVWDDGDGEALFLGGQFSNAGGVAVNHVAKWDGSAWSALSGAAGTGANNTVVTLAVFDDGGGEALYAGGHFTTAGGASANRVARWDGSTWSRLSSGMNNSVSALAVWDAGSGPSLYVAGHFTSAGGVTVNRVARWNGSLWSALAGPAGVGVNFAAQALAVWNDGSGEALYAGGDFTIAGGVTVNRIAKWDGSTWSALSGPSGTGVSDTVYALAAWDDGGGSDLYVGGSFTVTPRPGPSRATHALRGSGGLRP